MFLGICICEPVNAQNQHELETYFNKNQLDQIQKYVTDYKNIKTAHDLHTVYLEIVQMSRNLEDTLSAKQEKTVGWNLEFSWMDTIISGLSFNRYEGTAVSIKPKLQIFKSIAKSTPEKCDDDFIEIIISTYGEEYFFPKWIHQTWDYGGTSLLGDETELNILIKIQTTLSSNKEFEMELNKIKQDILSDIVGSGWYNYNSQKIIAEINKILAYIKLTEEEKNRLMKRIEEFKNPPQNLHIDCEHKECKCGG